MKKSKILSLILCAVLVIAFASLDASAATNDSKTLQADGSVNFPLKDTGLSASKVTPTILEEKSVDDNYYKISGLTTSEKNVAELKIGGSNGTKGDTFMSFDFMGKGFDFISIKGTVLDENGTPGNYQVAELLRISPKNGIYENGKSIIGFDTQNEKFFDASKIKQNRWNSVQLEICCVEKTLTITLNGETKTFDASGVLTAAGKNDRKVDYGFYAFFMSAKAVDEQGGELLLDNLYIQGHKADATVNSLDAKFKETDPETGKHYEHLGAVTEHSIAVANPAITNIKDAILRDGKVPHYNAKGEYTEMVDAKDASGAVAAVKHYYVKPGSAVSDAVANTATSNNTSVSFWNEALTAKYTENLPSLENCVALIPVTDGGGKVRTFCVAEDTIATGPFEYGMSYMNSAANTFFSVTGFNPTITPDEAKALYNGKTLVIPNKFDGVDIQSVKHYAFYTPADASKGIEEVTYPEIDFDLSKVVMDVSGKDKSFWPGQYSFSKTGIKKVEFNTYQGWAMAYCFADCDSLTYVDLKNVAGGQQNAFANCDNLETVKVDNIESWTWGGGSATFENCPKLTEMTFNTTHTTKPWIDEKILDKASSLKTIKVMDAAGNGVKYLDNNVTLYAAAYDSTGKMVGISVLKKLDESHNYKTLTIPEGAHVKIFNIKKDGSFAPQYYYDSGKKKYSYQPAITLK